MDPFLDPNMDPKSSDILVTSKGCQILGLTRSGPDPDPAGCHELQISGLRQLPRGSETLLKPYLRPCGGQDIPLLGSKSVSNWVSMGVIWGGISIGRRAPAGPASWSSPPLYITVACAWYYLVRIRDPDYAL